LAAVRTLSTEGKYLRFEPYQLKENTFVCNHLFTNTYVIISIKRFYSPHDNSFTHSICFSADKLENLKKTEGYIYRHYWHINCVTDAFRIVSASEMNYAWRWFFKELLCAML